jgi:hypothetical protein
MCISSSTYCTSFQGAIYWKIFPPLGGGGEYQPMSFLGGKYEMGKRKKRENVTEKGREGKENEKRGRKRVK